MLTLPQITEQWVRVDWFPVQVASARRHIRLSGNIVKCFSHHKVLWGEYTGYPWLTRTVILRFDVSLLLWTGFSRNSVVGEMRSNDDQPNDFIKFAYLFNLPVVPCVTSPVSKGSYFPWSLGEPEGNHVNTGERCPPTLHDDSTGQTERCPLSWRTHAEGILRRVTMFLSIIHCIEILFELIYKC